jgi:ADP-ribose diphosphatase
MVRHWELLDSRQLHDYRFFRVRSDRARSPRTQAEHEFYVLEMGAWVNVVALTPGGRVVMIRQYRHGTRAVGLEIPGGVIDDTDASPEAAAWRELEEETGYRPARMVYLGQVAPNPAIQDNLCHTFLALDAEPVGSQCLDAGEDIVVEEVEQERVPDLIADGTINHGLVVVALYFYERYRATHSELGASVP